MIQTFHRMWRTQGPRGILHAAARRVMRTPVSAFDAAEALVCGKTGLEIGGSSALFGRGRLLPVYPLASHIDNCNFSRRTVWEGDITEGDTFQFDSRKKPGSQYLAEAADLSLFRDAAYDFILSSHTLEHVANPLRALAEWKRVLKGEGALLLVLPHRDGTFDHRRPVTTLAHLIDDFERSTGEDDLSHLAEILSYHDLARDPDAGNFEAFKARSENNLAYRCMHHHVFDTPLALAMLDHAGFDILAAEAVRPFHVVAVARKLSAGRVPDNRALLSTDAAYRRRSPFPSDHPN